MVPSDTFLKKFDQPADEEWAFLGQKSVNHLTHGYHRYPAKFLPQLVKKLIEDYTTQQDRIADIFAGCGTTLVESKVHGRDSIGVDVNPVAQLITRAKITPICPDKLKTESHNITQKLKDFDHSKNYLSGNTHGKIDYWFREDEKNKISFIYEVVLQIDDSEIQVFFLCALSNILKTCSRWLQSSTKPQIDPDRNEQIPDPLTCFQAQIKKMSKKNQEFHNSLSETDFLDTKCEILDADARNTGIADNSIGAIITSPPYVTSYEYADIHQLTGYWFDYFSEISTFRKKFIGTFYSNKEISEIKSPLAKKVIAELSTKEAPGNKVKKYIKELSNFFNDMFDVSGEMHRILKPQGKACLVIGNTTLKNVEIKSAQIFAELLELNGFEISEVIKRKITQKLIPTIRDKNSGKFTTLDAKNSKKIYPEEYIIIATKAHDRLRSS